MRIEGRTTDKALALVGDVHAAAAESVGHDLDRGCQMPRLSCHMAAPKGEGAGLGRRREPGVSPPLGPHARLVPKNSLGAEVAEILR
jgi:hypothetical protein